MTPADKERLGFRNTKDLVVRAQTCVDCHVGAADRDVNHDLIAAGHPRLRFEFGAYLANYPRHWSIVRDKAGRPDFEARAWAVGQVVSELAALDVLEHRATDKNAPWPEFAEYGCFSCHQEIKPKVGGAAAAENRPVGSLPWGTWYFALADKVNQKGVIEPVDEIRKLMAPRNPDRTKVAQQAAAARKELVKELPGVREWGPVRERMALLARDDAAARSWDSSTQLYLALAAHQNALSDLGKTDPEVRAALKALALQLDQAFPKDERVKYDSPSRFNRADVESALERLRLKLKE
jgi:hypothetical protein